MNNKVFRIQMIDRGLKCLKNGGECEFRWYYCPNCGSTLDNSQICKELIMQRIQNSIHTR